MDRLTLKPAKNSYPLDAPHFYATKLDAYSERGKGYLSQRDIEDVVAVVDGRMELHGELAAAGEGVRR